MSSRLFWTFAFGIAFLQTAYASELESLILSREGRSYGSTSTHKLPDGNPDPNSNGDNFTVKPGDTHVLANLKGPGIIQHIWMTFLGPEPHEWAKEGAADHSEMLLRMTWDGRDHPDVEAPVGDFFAAGFGQRMEVNSIPVQVENGASYNCFWPMPFAKSARIEILNQSDKSIALLYYHLDWLKRNSLPKDTPYFCARYRQEFPAEQGKDYVILDAEGKGHYVGAVLSNRSRSPEWFGEGDIKITIDDDKAPSIWGTGTEDYFLSAWGLRECSFPYFGVPFTDGFGVFGGKTITYRWHIADPVVFQKRIRVAIEHFGWISPDENKDQVRDSWNEREDDFSSVAFWYQAGASKQFSEIPSAKERKLPNLDLIIGANQIAQTMKRGEGNFTVQNGELWTSGSQILYQPSSAQNAWLEIPFSIAEKEPRRLLLKLTRSYDFGNYAVYLDGVKLRDKLDLYSKKTDVREFHLLDFWPDPGEHVIRLECVEKSEDSSGHWLGLDSIRLRERRPRVKEWGFDKDKDWKTEKTLY